MITAFQRYFVPLRTKNSNSIVNSIVRNAPIFTGPQINNNRRSVSKIVEKCASSKRFSSSTTTPKKETKDDIKAAAQCAKDLSEILHRPNGSTEVSRLLSPRARSEIASVKAAIEKAAPAAEIVPCQPSRRELYLVGLNQAVPFIGFGLMDNAIMILAGDAIDQSLGVILGISTLCAAALGNIISDVAGVMMGTIIEDYCSKLGLPRPNITEAQRTLRSVRFSGQLGCALGLTLGCIIGMFPLLWINTSEVERQKKHAMLDGVFRDIVDEAKGLIGAETTILFVLTEENDESGNDDDFIEYLVSKYVGGTTATAGGSDELKVPLGRGIISRVIMTGEAVNSTDVQDDPEFDIHYSVRGAETKSMLIVPVFDSRGNVIAAIQAVNKINPIKQDGEESEGGINIHQYLTSGGRSKNKVGFTNSDRQIMQALASHVSIFLRKYDVNQKDLIEEKGEMIDAIRNLSRHKTTDSDKNQPTQWSFSLW
eukprot:CAMPEP_0194369400 /NCGR_PEP_ID=MMETSP0174-20130528/17694_1 /TAXON_ID=216777 /ORGANISM="Proboscia alata, Strain PI-D3" /LENGTH=481 /DNA_ID=CAMNT_0039146311 /DNA_START=48 /DNA_END=1493 /DNA_ORIENTATION=-